MLQSPGSRGLTRPVGRFYWRDLPGSTAMSKDPLQPAMRRLTRALMLQPFRSFRLSRPVCQLRPIGLSGRGADALGTAPGARPNFRHWQVSVSVVSGLVVAS